MCKILFRFVSIMTEIFRLTWISQLPTANRTKPGPSFKLQKQLCACHAWSKTAQLNVGNLAQTTFRFSQFGCRAPPALAYLWWSKEQFYDVGTLLTTHCHRKSFLRSWRWPSRLVNKLQTFWSVFHRRALNGPTGSWRYNYFISLSLKNRPNKLECLFLASLSSQVYFRWFSGVCSGFTRKQ